MKCKRLILTLFLLFVCVSALCISASAYDTRDLTPPECATKIVYGRSGAGRDLVAYKFGNGENVLIAGFAIHGYEDNFDKDGGCLVYTANELMKQLDQNRDRITDYGWSVYVLPSMNPDGLIDGYTCNGPGRCTTSYLNSAGELVYSTGVDLNRSFPHNWTQYSDSRNFNGSYPLASREAQALAEFIQDVKGKGNNICIDAHGWFSQIITSTSNTSRLYYTFATRFPGNSYANCTNSRGYFTSYAASLGYMSCLFEFPYDVYSMSYFKSSGYCEKFNACILDLLSAYGSYNGHSERCASEQFTDVIKWKWYHDSVDYVLDLGLFNGVSDTKFAPNSQMSRAMLVTTLYRLYAYKDRKSPRAGQHKAEVIPGEDVAEPLPPDDSGEEEPGEVEVQGFTDVPADTWYTEAVNWAASIGLVNGFPDNTFAPNAPITREQLAAIFYRYSAWCGRELESYAPLDSFPDGDRVSDYAKGPMCWAVGKGLINGIADGSTVTLSPKGTATRAQTAAILQRYYQLTHGSAVLKSPEPEVYAPADPNVDAGFGDLGGN